MKLYGRKKTVVADSLDGCEPDCETSNLPPGGDSQEKLLAGKQMQQIIESSGGQYHLKAANKQLQRRLDEMMLDNQALSHITAGK